MAKPTLPTVTAEPSAAPSSAALPEPTGLTVEEARHAIASIRGLSPWDLANGRDVGREADTIEGWAAHAKPAERELLEREGKFLRAAALIHSPTNDPQTAQIHEETYAILARFAELYPDDVPLQIFVAGLLRSATLDAVGWGLKPSKDDESLERKGAALGKALLRRFPENVDVVAFDASHCEGESNAWSPNFDPSLAADECIRRYDHCLALDPKRPDCISGLANEKERYTSPYCTTANIKPTVALRVASVDGKTAVKATVGKKKLPTDEPFLHATDISVIHSYVAHEKGEDAGGAHDRSTLYVEIGTGARDAVKKTRANMEAHDADGVGLFDGSTFLGATYALDLSEDGALITFFHGADLARICNKVERRALPAE